MTQQQLARMALGWSREKLAYESGVAISSVYLRERMGTAGWEDDERMREAIADGRPEGSRRIASGW